MVSDRKQRGYIWGESQLDYAHLFYYDAAMKATDIRDEENMYQRVFHSKSHSAELTKEVFQKKTRNNVSSFNISTEIVSTLNSDIVNAVKSEEYKVGISYSRVADESKTNEYKSHLQDDTTSIYFLVKDICKICTNNEIKVLAYLIVRENLDSILLEFESFQVDLPMLYEFIHKVWEDNIVDINRLNAFIGTKYSSDVARHGLISKIKEKFPNFMGSRK